MFIVFSSELVRLETKFSRELKGRKVRPRSRRCELVQRKEGQGAGLSMVGRRNVGGHASQEAELCPRWLCRTNLPAKEE